MSVESVPIQRIEYNSDILEPKGSFLNTWFPLLRWRPTSAEKLKEAEEIFVGYIKSPSEGFYVNVGQLGPNCDDCRIWTRKFNSKFSSEKLNLSELIEEVDETNDATDKKSIPNSDYDDENIPIVIVHGMGAGMAMFAKNIDNLIEETNKTIFTIDLPGFGRSSRTNLGDTPDDVDTRMVTALERWREALGLNKFYLLGHSFGGYLSALYSQR